VVNRVYGANYTLFFAFRQSDFSNPPLKFRKNRVLCRVRETILRKGFPEIFITATTFYGGSFDPPHSGHLGIALSALDSGRTNRVLFAPAFDPPHKSGHCRAPFADRLAMVKLLIGNRPGLEACDIEERLALSPSYTCEVLAALRRERPGERIQLLIGGDSLLALHTWGHAEELVGEYEILTYPRRGETPDAAALALHWPPRTVRKLLAGLLPGEFFEISSTNIRNGVAKQDKMRHINSEATERVEEYIRQHHLYEKRILNGK